VKGTTRYGWRTWDIDAVAQTLEGALSIEFQPRDSLYLGEYYLWPPFPREQPSEAELTLLPNFFDDIDQELTYPEHPEHGVMLDVSGVGDEWMAVIAALPGVEVLRGPHNT
jgi:hypothetical protein